MAGSTRHRAVRLLAVTVAAASLLAPARAAALPAVSQLLPLGADFDGDGYADLVMAAPGTTLDGVEAAGTVVVLYGAAAGLSSDRSQEITADDAGLPPRTRNEVPPGIPAFGAALATGDFDGDGFDDLAVAAPGADVGTTEDAGEVVVLYGSSAGLTTTGSQRWTEDSTGVVDTAEANDRFGTALVAADVGGGPEDDLVVGVPGETVGTAAGAGAIHLVFGSPSGLTADGDNRVTQNSAGMDDTAEAGDEFGFALATGRFDSDDRDDLAVGVPGEPHDTDADAGAVHVLAGTVSGPVNARVLDQGTDVPDMPERNDRFGTSLAAGDIDGDGFDDLGVGVPDENVAAAIDAGAVNVFYGAATGLAPARSQVWHQDRTGVPEQVEAGDAFGSGLVVADFDGDGFGDLAIGIEDEWVGAIDRAGAVALLYGASGGLAAARSQLWSQDSTDVADTAEEKDHWGTGLAVGAYVGDGRADLAVGAMDDTIGGVTHAGVVNVLVGAPGGLTGTGGQLWYQDAPGVAGEPAVNDKVGFRLA
jgi:hypothetical protein